MLTEHGGGIRLHVMIYQRHSRKSTGLAGCWYAGMAAARLFNTMSTHTLLPPRPTVTLPPPSPQAVSTIFFSFFCLHGLSSNTLRFCRYCLVLYFYPVHPNPVDCLHLSNGSPPSPAFISLNPNSTVCFHFCPNPPDPVATSRGAGARNVSRYIPDCPETRTSDTIQQIGLCVRKKTTSGTTTDAMQCRTATPKNTVPSF